MESNENKEKIYLTATRREITDLIVALVRMIDSGHKDIEIELQKCPYSEDTYFISDMNYMLC